MQIQRKETASIFGGPIVAQINHHTDVRVASAQVGSAAVARFLPADRGVEVPMIGVLIDQRVNAWIRIEGVRSHEMCAGEFVPKMSVDRVDEKEFAVFVPIVAPWVGCP